MAFANTRAEAAEKNLHLRSSRARRESLLPLDKDLSWKSANRKHRYWHYSASPALSGLNTELIVHSMPESLLATQVFFSGLHGYMTEQELDLLKLTP